MDSQHEIILFQSEDGMVRLPVSIDASSQDVWLTRNEMAKLYDRDVKTVGKHINNALKEELLNAPYATVAKFATVQKEGARSVTRNIEYYCLDIVLSVGYRVKSNRGIEFRRWANDVLRRYTLKGYAANEKRLAQLGQVVNVMDRLPDRLDARQVLDVVKRYTHALDLLDDYDHQTLTKPDGARSAYVLSYGE